MMRFENLCKESQEYVDRYIRCSNKTREDALKEAVVINVVAQYEEENERC